MYIPPVILNPLTNGIFANQIAYEKKIIQYIHASHEKHILDVGCGRGAVAMHVAKESGARVTGMNIDPNQIKLAKESANKKDMTGNLDFVIGSFNEGLPFANESFDGLYDIQALSYSKNFERLFSEMFRVLKPGAKLSFLEWVIYDDYNEMNETHVDLMAKCKPLIGAVFNPSTKDYVDALEKAGFVVLVNENASIDGHQYQLIESADFYFTTLQRVVQVLVKFRVLPGHFNTLFDRFTKDAYSFIEGDKLNLWTSCHQIVAMKPN